MTFLDGMNYLNLLAQACKIRSFLQVQLLTKPTQFIFIIQMDNNTQDQYIQKRLLYKFDKKLDLVEQEYLRQIFPSPDNPRQHSNESMLEQIYALQFMNFKYRTALLSTNTDIARNEEELLSQQSSIQAAREEIKELNEQLHRAQIAMENKRKFNEIGNQIIKFDKKEVFDSKLKTIEGELQQLEEKYARDMKNYENKERLLKTSIAALKSFLNDFDQRNDTNDNPQVFRSAHGEPGEDDGQIY